jgi:hypothetical protein
MTSTKFPQPGTPEWLDAKRGGPRWKWEAYDGWHEGYMERFSNHGGTDVTYWFRRDPCGTLDLVSGARLKAARRIQ